MSFMSYDVEGLLKRFLLGYTDVLTIGTAGKMVVEEKSWRFRQEAVASQESL